MLTLFVLAATETAKATRPACKNGADGYIVTLKGAQLWTKSQTSRAEHFAATLRARWQLGGGQKARGGPDGSNEILFVYSDKVFTGLAARLDKSELAEVLSRDEVVKVSPNCLIHLSPDERKEAVAVRSTGFSKSSSAVEGRTVEGRSFQPFPPSWGLDRIDSRAGLDNNYTYGAANGAGTVVYVKLP